MINQVDVVEIVHDDDDVEDIGDDDDMDVNDVDDVAADSNNISKSNVASLFLSMMIKQRRRRRGYG